MPEHGLFNELCYEARRRGLHVELFVGGLRGPAGQERREPKLLRVTRDRGQVLARCSTSFRTLDADAELLLPEVTAR